MTASIQMKSDFIYPDSGELGQLIFEIKGAEKTPFLPRVFPVAPGLYLSTMTGPATTYPCIDFKVGNAPVAFCLTLSGRFSSTFSNPGRVKGKIHQIGPDTTTVGSFKGKWGKMVIDPSFPVTCVGTAY